MKKKELVAILKTLLGALIEAETPKPQLPMVPPAPTPLGQHLAYIKADGSLCCERHSDEFERQAQRHGGGVTTVFPYTRYFR